MTRNLITITLTMKHDLLDQIDVGLLVYCTKVTLSTESVKLFNNIISFQRLNLSYE